VRPKGQARNIWHGTGFHVCLKDPWLHGNFIWSHDALGMGVYAVGKKEITRGKKKGLSTAVTVNLDGSMKTRDWAAASRGEKHGQHT
jgi:hypothetical protein